MSICSFSTTYVERIALEIVRRMWNGIEDYGPLWTNVPIVIRLYIKHGGCVPMVYLARPHAAVLLPPQ